MFIYTKKFYNSPIFQFVFIEMVEKYVANCQSELLENQLCYTCYQMVSG